MKVISTSTNVGISAFSPMVASTQDASTADRTVPGRSSPRSLALHHAKQELKRWAAGRQEAWTRHGCPPRGIVGKCVQASSPYSFLG